MLLSYRKRFSTWRFLNGIREFSSEDLILLRNDLFFYNPLQSKFFETFAAPLTKRGLLLKFLILGGGSLLTYVSASSTGYVLPMKRGPQEKPKLGPRGKI